MTIFLWHIFMAAVWAFAVGNFSLPDLAVGFGLGYVILWLGGDLIGASAYCRRVPRLAELVLFFLWQLLLANLRVAVDVMTPRHRMRPAIIALPLDVETDIEILLLTNMITLTPGTLSLDVSPDRRVLYVHSMYIRDVEEEKHTLKNGFERRLLEVMR